MQTQGHVGTRESMQEHTRRRINSTQNPTQKPRTQTRTATQTQNTFLQASHCGYRHSKMRRPDLGWQVLQLSAQGSWVSSCLGQH